MTRTPLSQNYQTRAPITLVDWVSSGVEVDDWVNVIAGSQFDLVAIGEEPEGYVPGGGRCVRLTKDDGSDRIMKDLSLPAAVDLGDTSCVIEVPVYYPGPFNQDDQTASCGVAVYVASGGYVTDRYAKTFYPGVTDPRQGWNTFSFPLESLNTAVGMSKNGSPNVMAINYMRLALENVGASGSDSRYAYVGPIRARRRTRPKVVISFDDGIDSVYTKALPIMSALEIPGTIAVITSLVGSSGKMTWAEISDLVETYGWSVISHGETGLNFRAGGVTEADIADEMRNSVAALSSRGYDSPYYAWSGGAYTEYAKTLARELGIIACLDIGSDFQKTPYGPSLSGDYGNFARVPAEDVGGTVTALQYVDEAIRLGYSCFLYAHNVIVGASGPNTTNETEFQTLMTALAARRQSGLIDIVNIDQWGQGMISPRSSAD